MPNVVDLSLPENKISGMILDQAFYIHKALGPGLLESAYEKALIHFLKKEGLKAEAQKPIPIKIDNCTIETGFRADLIVENSVICEIKSIHKLAPIHEAQLMTYFKIIKH